MNSSGQSKTDGMPAPAQAFNTIAGRVIVALFIAAAAFTVLSIEIIANITQNYYTAEYYTLGALFDANAFNADALVASQVAPFSAGFYVLVGVSVLDGAVKAVLIGFVLAAFINFLRGIDLTARIGIAMSRRLKGHVIVCGYSMLAERLCKELHRRRVPFLVVDKDLEKIEVLRDEGYRALNGDFTKADTLADASLTNSKAVIFATESDFANLMGIVTAKHIFPKAHIMARASSEGDASKMRRGGARYVQVPEVVGGQELGDSIRRLW